MKLLIDECLPRALKRLLTGHECRTVQEMGWSGKKNGILLALADTEFDALLTIDQGIEFQQGLADRKIVVLVFSAPSNKTEDLTPLVPAALDALRSIKQGSSIRIGT